LNLRGRRLDPLRTESIRLVLRPRAQGTFIVKPRIMYLDDESRYRYHEPEACEIRVKELGLSGWLRGPHKRP